MKLAYSDKQINKLIKQEAKRQKEQLQLIASENYVSKAVREAVGSVLMNKYAEGQPGKRYYQGNRYIDEIEVLAKTRALDLFKLDAKIWDVNVQAVSGSIANLAVYMALLAIGDKMLSMYLYDGGHLSHGWKLANGKAVSMTAKLYDASYYHVDPNTYTFNYDEIEKIAIAVKPKIIISGGTAYPREIDYKRMGEIAKKVGAYYLADVAHEAGLISAGVCNSPFEFADVVTMTTRKTLRGPIGAAIFSKKALSEQIDKAVFPGLQGGPLNHSIAGIAVALNEANTEEFREYARNVVSNAKTLASKLQELGYEITSGGTDKHLFLVDLRNKDIDGWAASYALEMAGIICNKTTIPNDTGSPYYPSGLRFGTPTITTRGMGDAEMGIIADYIDLGIKVAQKSALPDFKAEDLDKRNKARVKFKKSVSKNTELKEIKNKVKQLCDKFPLRD